MPAVAACRAPRTSRGEKFHGMYPRNRTMDAAAAMQRARDETDLENDQTGGARDDFGRSLGHPVNSATRDDARGSLVRDEARGGSIDARSSRQACRAEQPAARQQSMSARARAAGGDGVIAAIPLVRTARDRAAQSSPWNPRADATVQPSRQPECAIAYASAQTTKLYRDLQSDSRALFNCPHSRDT